MKSLHVFNGISEVLPEMWIFLAPIIILQLIMMASALISISKKRVLLSEKIIWILISICITIAGPVIYFVIGSKMIDEKISRESEDVK